MAKNKKAKSTVKSNPFLTIITASIEPSGIFADLLEMLGPLLADLLAQFMENCAVSEDDAVELFAEPRYFQIVRAERQTHRRLRREDKFRKLTRPQRSQFVNQVMLGVNDTANENPQLVRDAYRSL